MASRGGCTGGTWWRWCCRAEASPQENTSIRLFDIKQLNLLKHRKYTGIDNDLILENARRFAGCVETWFRIPLVANVNDSIEHIGAVTDLADKLGIRKVSLLPYHEGGVSKAAQIGIECLLPDAKSPNDEHIKLLAQIVSERGIKVSIGH